MAIFLERIADGEMQRLVATELIDVVEAALRGLIRHMQTYTPVKSQDEEVEVVAQADACSHRHLLKEFTETEISLFKHNGNVIDADFQILTKPHVTGIEEHGTVQVAKQPLAIFQVGLQLHITILQEI